MLTLMVTGCVSPLSKLTRRSTVTLGSTTAELRAEPDGDADEARVRASVQRVAPRLDRWGPLDQPIIINIVPSHEALVRTVGADYDWLRAWAQFDSLILQAPRTWALNDTDLDELVLHELTHCVLFQRSGTASTWADRRIPLWFREGMATVTADQGLRYPSLEDLADWVTTNAEIDVFQDAERLSKASQAQVYGLAFHAMRFLLKRTGDARVLSLMKTMKGGADFDAAFTAVTGTPPRKFEADFLTFLRLRGFRGFGLKVRPAHPPLQTP